ncbi:hypothetical protein [Rhodovulum marinum]|uniref:Uncharacterized protein n=1 Tax=Rhodovulum marinum TaxID=320662 RepID=A0A4R2QAN5_9RHOB|nr:hypothetical protein [Rhodovulum marinum]TCP43961.1 hypothetical protein EV662_10146 [Rhodovulum marinum]
MAEEIANLCRQYVADNAAALDARPEEEAVRAMVNMLHRHAAGEGWEALDYHLNVEEVARDGLKRHRKRR